jgi:hypothetical protein
LGHKSLDPLLEYPSWHQHSTVAFQALDANVGTYTHHAPLEVATGMLLPQANDII